MFEYLLNQQNAIIDSLLSSSLAINATVQIQSKDVSQESIYNTGGMLDARQTAVINRKYPDGLQRFYRVRVLPLERKSVSVNGVEISYNMVGKYEPYDRWISCKKSQVTVRNHSTVFDYAEFVDIKNIRYRIKGVVVELEGNDPMIHVFLTKETVNG